MAGARYLDPSSIPLKRQSGGNIWATLVHITQVITGIVLLSGLMLFFVPVLEKAKLLNDQKKDLNREITAAQEQQQQLMVETEQMKNDPAYVEHIARDRLLMARPGEKVLLFDPYVITPVPAKPMTPTTANDDVSN
ncbi:MAG: septum formation initiator family protein [Methylacidiphilales bacterium]|nr:septum formation initiator family protein [Candidatus Methylacidiphilales bacterium]